MNRLLCLIICFFLLLMTGCGAKDMEIPMVHHVQGTEAATAAIPETEAESPAFSRGTWTGNAYVSTFAGLNLTLPGDGWTKTDALALEEMTSRTDDGTIIDLTDFEAQNEAAGESIIVMFENLARSEETNAVTAEEYAGIIAEMLENNGEFACTVYEPETCTLCGREYVCLRCSVEEGMLEQLYFLRREGEMMTVVILTGADANALIGFFG